MSCKTKSAENIFNYTCIEAITKDDRVVSIDWLRFINTQGQLLGKAQFVHHLKFHKCILNKYAFVEFKKEQREINMRFMLFDTGLDELQADS
jgi:chaperone required for assembly of F1-ATPase